MQRHAMLLLERWKYAQKSRKMYSVVGSSPYSSGGGLRCNTQKYSENISLLRYQVLLVLRILERWPLVDRCHGLVVIAIQPYIL